MSSNTHDRIRVLKMYTKAVVHLRNQFETQRLGLIFGAGLSRSFKLPDWNSLVSRIANDKAVRGTNILSEHKNAGLPYQTELLFQHFRKREKSRVRDSDRREFDFDVHARWRRILWNHLYGENKVRLEKDDVASHPYLADLLRIVRRLRVTVTYNFDDLLEQALHATREKDELAASRGYVAVTNGGRQLHGRGPIVYHPNGFIPSTTLMETPSDRLVFSEHSYADELVDFLSGDHSRLITYLTDHTCLFVGLSLNDQGVRNVLRRSANSNPGSYHYMVAYMASRRKRSGTPKQEAQSQANFRVYNLVTLYLTNEEIAALASLIAMPESEFCDLAEAQGVRTKFCYYLTGPLGVGKSTAISSLGSLNTFDEWIEPRLPLLAKPWPSLSKVERKKADSWISRQFKLKNDNVRKRKCGIYVLDRGPLDPLAFTKRKAWLRRAKSHMAAICPQRSSWRVENGCVVLLTGDHGEMSLRLRLTQRDSYTATLLEKMETELVHAYGKSEIVKLDTKGLSPSAVVHKLARLIHLKDYEESDLHSRLAKIATRGAT